MSGQRQAERQKSTHADTTDHVEPKPQPKAAELSAETADLLDDIDELLNEMPQDLAANFKQRGGQ